MPGQILVSKNPRLIPAPAAPKRLLPLFSIAVTGFGVTVDASDTMGVPLNYEWTYGDGDTGTGVTDIHTYIGPGTYLITLKVTNLSGVTQSATKSITLVPVVVAPVADLPPVAEFTFVATFLSVAFSGAVSTGSGLTYAWNFGDGATATGISPTHAYASAGTRNVTLVVTDNQSRTSTYAQSVAVGSTPNVPPTAGFTYTSSAQSVIFSSSASSDPDGTIVGYLWNFGDGSATSTAQNPTHAYASAIVYNVTLTVTDNSGGTATVTKPVTVAPILYAPTARFTYTVSGTQVTFTNTSVANSGTLSSYLWTFGDNTSSTARNPVKTYSDTGTYTVQLTVTDSYGGTANVQKFISVKAAPVLDVSFAMTSGKLSSITYNGYNYFRAASTPYAKFTYADTALPRYEVLLPTIVSEAANSQTCVYSNGVRVRYDWSAVANKFIVGVSFKNTNATRTIKWWSQNPFFLGFPSAVTVPFRYAIVNAGDVPYIAYPTSSGDKVVLVEEELSRPLYAMLQVNDPPTNQYFKFVFGSDQIGLSASYYPDLNRPVAPGATDTFSFSLRFSPVSRSLSLITADIPSKWGTARPFKVGLWSDRKKMALQFLAPGAVYWGTSAVLPGYEDNPRGWFHDTNLSLVNPDGSLKSSGIPTFQTLLLARADSMINKMVNMNANWALVWDLEGEQFYHPLTYIGDPRLVGTMAPEMETTVNYGGVDMPVVDAFFKKLRDAGFKVGVTIRPQILSRKSTGMPVAAGTNMMTTGLTDDLFQRGDPSWTAYGDDWDEITRSDLLISKIQYAYTRWGCEIFYVDTCRYLIGDYWSRVLDACPYALIIPEHYDIGLYSATSPLGRVHGSADNTLQGDPFARQIWPNSFASIQYIDVTPSIAERALLVDGVRQGDILAFNSWYTNYHDNEIISIYTDAGR